MSDDNVPVDNDNEEPQRPLTENEKNIKPLMQAVAEFVHKYENPSDLPPKPLEVRTHLGSVFIQFNPDKFRQGYLKVAQVEFMAAMVAKNPYATPDPDKIAKSAYHLACVGWEHVRPTE